MNCDIYLTAHVDAMKAENERLKARVRELVAENTQMAKELDRHRRARAYRHDECDWMNGC